MEIFWFVLQKQTFKSWCTNKPTKRCDQQKNTTGIFAITNTMNKLVLITLTTLLLIFCLSPHQNLGVKAQDALFAKEYYFNTASCDSCLPPFTCMNATVSLSRAKRLMCINQVTMGQIGDYVIPFKRLKSMPVNSTICYTDGFYYSYCPASTGCTAKDKCANNATASYDYIGFVTFNIHEITAGIVLPITWITTLVGSILVIWRRNRFPLRGRSAISIVGQSIFQSLFVSILSLQVRYIFN